MKLQQTSHWYYVHRYFVLVLALVVLLPVVRALFSINLNYLQFKPFPEVQAIYFKHDILQICIWCIAFLLLFLTYLFQKHSRKSTLTLIYLQNILFPLFLVMYTVQTNHMFRELVECGFYQQTFTSFNPPIAYDEEIVKEKLDYEALLRTVRMGILLVAGGTALTLNSIYFTKRKSLFQDGDLTNVGAGSARPPVHRESTGG